MLTTQPIKSRYSLSLLNTGVMPVLRETFLKAFADYLIPIQLTPDQFDAKKKRERIRPDLCAAAFYDQEMVGFIVTGVGEWNGRLTAYNAGTGVIPAHRGKQLTKHIYTFLIKQLKAQGVVQCLLEVIDISKPAIAIYKSLGFEITRALDCFRVLKTELVLKEPTPENVLIVSATEPDWEIYKQIGNTKPSWQNMAIAFEQFPGDKVVLEAWDADRKPIGYIAFFPKTGVVLQMGVHAAYRKQGVGEALLNKAADSVKAPALLMTNVDTKATDLINFLLNHKFKKFLTQYEMLLSLKD